MPFEQEAPQRDDKSTSQALHTTLRKTFSTSLQQHFLHSLAGLPLAVLFHQRSAHIHPFFRLFTTTFALFYYPFLCLTASILLSPLTYFRRQTKALESLLGSLLDLLISPLRQIKSPTLQKISARISQESKDVLKKEAGVRKWVIWVMLKVVTKVLNARFGEMFKDEQEVTAEVLGRIVGKELIGFVLGPVQQTVVMGVLGVVVGTTVFGLMPFILVSLFSR